jgi:hypothetical protein
MKCRFHPDEDAVAVCQKFGYGYCRNCCQEPKEENGCACTSPEEHCKFRQECLVHYAEGRRRKGLEGI